MTRPNEQRAVQTERRDRVGRGKLPSRKDRLHDFETMRNPVDALQQCSLIDAKSWRDGEPEDDLRLLGGVLDFPL